MLRSLAALTLSTVTGCEVVFPLDDKVAGGFDAAHVPDREDLLGTSPVQLVGSVIDTDTLAISNSDLSLVMVAQEAGGPDLAVLRGTEIELLGNILVSGSRPLVIIGTTITVGGIVDASANGAIGNRLTVDANGKPGRHTGDGNTSATADSGGGGGSFELPGGNSGSTCFDGDALPDLGASAGAVIPSAAFLTVLQGGGAGGDGSQDTNQNQELTKCADVAVGGGGGGAVQLSASISITIQGTIDVSGGGGAGGVACAVESAGGGGGGGAGGAIYLEAPAIEVRGNLAANGGGGGGGGRALQAPSTQFDPGTPGADGAVGIAPALGGNPPAEGNRGGTIGGTGGAGDQPASSGGNTCLGQSGGGGGAVGGIVVRGTEIALEGTISPGPQQLAP